ncbi:hypothetical protein MNEG_6081 [Monoraphidium neglectum]|uniref:Tim44-like domain-containing protein n=1 Tax=Monoraphidium neglectum TaxID=145388 RepID=A0A0D2MMU2_9CHLO|nr:hypothetical protein MNEG_6081 [Monoraphidium neglectum]KIZ01882.1 hypothetical protein MNEG_6081 [Monoraphidium neglectum]|eukprot:XP_013900901.1 hypothetical protein MNEG_6081 [Monoraphidium neglectum]
MRPIRLLTQRGSERLMRNAIEEEFDAAEFLDGAKGAVREVMARYGEKDWEALEGMVSKRMLLGMKEEHDNLLEQRQLKVVNISTDIQEASLQLPCVWGRRSIKEYDEERARAPLISGAAPFWNVIFVNVISRVRVRLADAHSGRMATNATSRQGVFVFARGPLPRQVVPEVHPPWWMVGWL